jgi:hypothetical protein
MAVRLSALRALRTVSSEKKRNGTIYLLQHIFENSTVNINALRNSWEHMTCCSNVQCTVQWNSSVSETVLRGHMYICTFLLRMADTVTSENIDLPPGVSCTSIYRCELQLNSRNRGSGQKNGSVRPLCTDCEWCEVCSSPCAAGNMLQCTSSYWDDLDYETLCLTN